jgi:hypothetical protein
MKQVTVTRNVFTIRELPDKAGALEQVRTDLYDYIDSNQITDHLNGELYSALTGTYDGEISKKELSKRVGLTVEWSLSHCQGDGVAIYGTLNRSDALNVNWGGADNATFTRNSAGNHYSHEHCMTVALFEYDDETGYEIDADKETTEKFAEQFRDLCRELARSGYAEIENLTSIDAAVEYLDNNLPRRFNENGTYAPTEFWGE